MEKAIKRRNFFKFVILGIVTLGIYPIIYWNKVSDDVNVLCEGDGKKTMKFVYAWLLCFVTFGIFGIIWDFKLAKRLNNNAARYNLRFSETGGLTVVLNTIGIIILGPVVASFILTKNFNKLAVAFNEYNGLEEPVDENKIDLFADEEVEA